MRLEQCLPGGIVETLVYRVESLAARLARCLFNKPSILVLRIFEPFSLGQFRSLICDAVMAVS